MCHHAPLSCCLVLVRTLSVPLSCFWTCAAHAYEVHCAVVGIKTLKTVQTDTAATRGQRREGLAVATTLQLFLFGDRALKIQKEEELGGKQRMANRICTCWLCTTMTFAAGLCTALASVPSWNLVSGLVWC